ncbi:MAG TPA: DUF5916 domain-containing protein [Vicinamibacteria bacterium]|nr:DUF5916 domain-containing protein [Vicinamibacteria bacterium]
MPRARRLPPTLALLLIPLSAASDDGRHRTYTASPVGGLAPIVDGRLDDPAWMEAAVATDLVQRRPNPGALATLATEARLLYDTEALYVGVRLRDPLPARIVAPYPRRDDETTSDWVFVEVDSRHDRRTAFSFGLNPRGVQVDGVFFDDTSYDTAWNAVWQGAARIDAEGWTAEFRIPFSQIVYAAEGRLAEDGSRPATFGMNVYRYSPARGESSNWSPRLPELAGIVSNLNELHLRVPARRTRVELAPYVSAGSAGASGGLDLRARLGSVYTLAAAVHPDFGQVEADPSEVNLTTFETQLTERRPFFVEEAGLFAFDLGLPFVTRGNSFAAEQAFYSRRIGRPPRLAIPGDAVVRERPDAATLLAAAKVTGRTSDGWSSGALASLTGSETARFETPDDAKVALEVEPVTAFAVGRVARDFESGRSAVGAIATVVDRSHLTPALAVVLPRRALALGLSGRHRFRKDTYEATAFLVGSRVEGTPQALGAVLHGPGHYTQRPDATHLEGSAQGSVATGFAGQARLARIGGEHWRLRLALHGVSPRLELNDVGFQRNSDWLVATGSLTYQEERQGRVFRRWAVGSNQVGAGWSFGGERRATVFNLTANADLRNYWGGSLSWDRELQSLQTEALRGGPALLVPAREAFAVSLYSDTRRVSQATFDARGFREPSTGSHQLVLAPTLTLRPRDRLALSLGPTLAHTTNAWQFVGTLAGEERPRYVLGRLEQDTASLTLRADLAFSSRLTLQLYAEPFASRGRYDAFQEVVRPRAPRVADRLLALAGPPPVSDPSYHVRDLRANVVLRFEYRPGSVLFAVWTQNRHAETDASYGGPFRELGEAFHPAPGNSFLVKISYWFTPRKGG